MPMLSDFKPIIYNAPREAKEIVIHFIHDPHYGNECFDKARWERIVKDVQQEGHLYCLIGDLVENATVGSKSDVLYQTCPPLEQREWAVEQICRLGKDKCIGMTDGNHERRSKKDVGVFVGYDIAMLSGISDRYRPHFLFIDLGVGVRVRSSKTGPAQNRYTIFAVHKAKNLKNFCSSDYVDGCDVFAFGHDHDPQSHPRASLRYNPTKKTLSVGVTRVVNCGSNLQYGGYAVDNAYRPNALVEYKVHLSGTEKQTWVEER